MSDILQAKTITGEYSGFADSALRNVSSTFLTAHQDLSDYQTITGMTAYQPAGDYLTTADSANFYTTANESGFITGVDLTPYQTIEGMTAYQPVGDYYSASNPSGFITALPEEEEVEFEEIDISDYQPVSAMTAYLSSLPAGTMNESSFAYDIGNNITAYNGSAFKAGDEFPQSATEAIETVTANSTDWNGTTETVSSNSGVWGGSALPISAGPGIKVDLVDNTLVFSNDETVLFNGDLTANSSATLSESWLNFDRIKVFGYSQPGGSMNAEAQVSDISGNYLDGVLVADVNLATVASWVHRDNFNIIASMPIVFIDDTTISAMNGRLMGYWNGEWQTSFNEQRGHCTKVVGINRIAGGN